MSFRYLPGLGPRDDRVAGLGLVRDAVLPRRPFGARRAARGEALRNPRFPRLAAMYDPATLSLPFPDCLDRRCWVDRRDGERRADAEAARRTRGAKLRSMLSGES